MTKNRILGLDIGTNSLGWAIVEKQDDQFLGVIDYGVAKFGKSEGNDGKALGEARRINKSIRKRLHNRSKRIKKTEGLCKRFNLVSEDQLSFPNHQEKVHKKLHQPAKKEKPHTIIDLRIKALYEPISPSELARLMIYFAKHRGPENFWFKEFSKEAPEDSDAETKNKKKSNKSANLSEQDEKKAAYKAVLDNNFNTFRQGQKEGIYQTIAELIKDKQQNLGLVRQRNSTGRYDYTFTRDLVQEEFSLIVKKQSAYAHIADLEKIEKEYIKIVFDESHRSSRKNFEENLVGHTTYYFSDYPETNGLRAPLASYTAEMFNLHNELSNIRINGEKLTDFQRNEASHNFINSNKKKLTYKDLRSYLRLEKTDRLTTKQSTKKIPSSAKNLQPSLPLYIIAL